MNYHKTEALRFIQGYASRREEYLKSPAIDSDKAPFYIVALRPGSNPEEANLYLYYDIGGTYINRGILCLGYWQDLAAHSDEIELAMIRELNSIGLDAMPLTEYVTKRGNK